jgi:Zn-dependent M28 family amino/carboxypeptidase
VDELIERRLLAGGALALACGVLGCHSSLPAPPLPPGIAADVAYLGSPALRGRGFGTAESDSAAVYIARHYERLRLIPVFKGACPTAPACAASYFQFFSVDGARAKNVAVVVPGTDPALSDRYVVVGAHFDHLGLSTYGARDPQMGGAIRPGADDNASGTAAVMELGRRFAAHPPRQPVLLVHFDAEEQGMVGSRVFVSHPPVSRESLVLMVNLDMVGRLRSGGLTIDAAAAPAGVRRMIDSAALTLGLVPKHSSLTARRSDYASFTDVGIPTVALFTGFHSDYHTTHDIVARLDVPGIERIADLAEAIVRAAAEELSHGKR